VLLSNVRYPSTPESWRMPPKRRVLIGRRTSFANRKVMFRASASFEQRQRQIVYRTGHDGDSWKVKLFDTIQRINMRTTLNSLSDKWKIVVPIVTLLNRLEKHQDCDALCNDKRREVTLSSSARCLLCSSLLQMCSSFNITEVI
jgi:hypothetical protein